MPLKSQAQSRFMHGIASGSIAPKGGLTQAKAQKFLSDSGQQNIKQLPQRVGQAIVQGKSAREI